MLQTKSFHDNFQLKTDFHPSKITRTLSTSTTYSCWRSTFIFRVFVQLAILSNKLVSRTANSVRFSLSTSTCSRENLVDLQHIKLRHLSHFRSFSKSKSKYGQSINFCYLSMNRFGKSHKFSKCMCSIISYRIYCQQSVLIVTLSCNSC